MIEFPLFYPEIISYLIVNVCAKSSKYNFSLEAKDAIVKNKAVYCSECEINVSSPEQEFSEKTVIPIHQKYYSEGELPIYWMCKGCYSLLKPPNELLERTKSLYNDYKVRLPSKFFNLLID